MENKIQSMKEVDKMMKDIPKDDILETCFALQEFASDTKQLKSVRKIYDFIAVLTEKLSSDEEKIKVLAGFDRGTIERLDLDDKENSHPADPVDRIYAFDQNSFDFLRKIVNSIENNSILKLKSQEKRSFYFGMDDSPDDKLPSEYGYISSAQKYTPKDKLKIPYYTVAKRALMEWNGLSEEEAEKTILESGFDEIESQVYAKQSMDSAIAKISEISDIDASAISKMVFKGHKQLMNRESDYTNAKISNKSEISDIKSFFERKPNETIIDILSAVHDNWVRENSKKFFSREKKHQHMPIELIGWKEAKADLLFVQPILESMGIEVNEEELEKAYYTRVRQFFLDKGIRTNEDLAEEISKGAGFYSALEGQDNIIEVLSDINYVTDNVVPQIEEKGIGSVENIRRDIIKNVAKDPRSTDMDKLTEEEVLEVESKIDQENSELQDEYRILTEKERAIKRIKEKVEQRREIRKQIEQIKIEQKNKLSQNRGGFDD